MTQSETLPDPAQHAAAALLQRIPLGVRMTVYTLAFLGVVLGALPWAFSQIDVWLPAVHVELGRWRVIGVIWFVASLAAYLAISYVLAARGKGPFVEFDPPRELVIEGPYRYVRNPIVCALVSTMFGEAVALSSTGVLLMAVLFAVLGHVQVMRFEEPLLRQRYGKSYVDYCARVPRWLPRAPLGWRLYWHTLEGTWRAFGLSRELFVSGVRRPLFTAAARTAMALDHVFFPRFRRTPVRAPLFLIGHPRSGTTFLHRLLTQTREFSVFEFWEILCPSLTARVIVKPIAQRIIARGQGTFFPKETGHLGALDQVEEEELLFLHTGNTQFASCLSPLAFSDWDFTELVFADDQPPATRRRATRFLRGCLQRQLYATGLNRAVTKMNYSAMRTRSLLEEFPDAKFVYLVRSPLETIPSHLTLHRNMFNHLWGVDRIPQPLLARYYERRYRHNVAFYRYLDELIAAGVLPADRFLVVSYDELRNNLAETMARVIPFADLECSNRLRELITEQAAAQSRYERPHHNRPLEEFGLTRERIVSDLEFIFDRYGFSKA